MDDLGIKFNEIADSISQETDVLYILKLEYEYYESMHNTFENHYIELCELFNLICTHCYLYLIGVVKLGEVINQYRKEAEQCDITTMDTIDKISKPKKSDI